MIIYSNINLNFATYAKLILVISMNYGEQLMFLKDRNGLNNVKMASIIQVSDSLYSRYEKEKQIIPIKHLNSFANHFDVSIDYLFKFTNKKKYAKCYEKINIKKSSERLKKFRKDNNLTQLDLAKILNNDNSTISNYESGKSLIATPFLYMICQKYKISADYLLGKTDTPKYLD